MAMTSRSVVHYLLQRGAVSATSIVDGDLMVVDASRRHRNLKVFRRTGPGYFVKQVQDGDPRSVASLRREAACYWLVEHDPDFAALAPLLPRFHGYDAALDTLVVELFPEAENLSEYHRRVGAFPVEVARALGRGFGSYHRQVGGGWREAPADGVFPRALPWILTVHRHPPADLEGVSGANMRLLEILRESPELTAALDDLAAGWRIESLIHGDMKWDNCVVVAGGPGGDPALRIVDWELADFGAAGWDVGAIFAAYLTFWIFSMPVADEAATDRWIEEARYPLEAMQPAVRAFWSEYQDAAGLTGPGARARLLTAARYGAARMIQSAYEFMSASAQLSRHAVCLLQTSANVLTRTSEAVAELLGIREERS